MQFLQDVIWPEETAAAVSSKSSHSIRSGALNASTHHCTSAFSSTDLCNFTLCRRLLFIVLSVQCWVSHWFPSLTFGFICTNIGSEPHLYLSAFLSCFFHIILICLRLLLGHIISPPRSICSTCRLWIGGPRRPTWSTGSTPTATLAVTGTTDTPTDDGEDRGHHKPPLPLQTTNATPCTYEATWRLQHRA